VESVRSDKSELTYKSLPDLTQNIITLACHLTIITVAMLITDISTIFDFVGTVASSGITYIFPAVAYLTALSRYAKATDLLKW